MRGFDDPRGRQSEELAFEAERVERGGDEKRARALFAQAAELEEQVVADTDPEEPRVKSVLAVSSVALWYKAHRFIRAQALARHYLAMGAAADSESVQELRALIRRAQQDNDARGQRTTAPGAKRSAVVQRYCEVRDQIEWLRATRGAELNVPPTATAELERLWTRLDEEDRLAIEVEIEALESLEDTGEFLCVDVERDKVEAAGPRTARASR
jgi:hypothetical protein